MSNTSIGYVSTSASIPDHSRVDQRRGARLRMSAGNLSVDEFWRAAALDAPDVPFVIWNDSVTTYAQFDERVERAAAMWHQRGVRKGDRVIFMLDNSPEFLEAWF